MRGDDRSGGMILRFVFIVTLTSKRTFLRRPVLSSVHVQHINVAFTRMSVPGHNLSNIFQGGISWLSMSRMSCCTSRAFFCWKTSPR